MILFLIFFDVNYFLANIFNRAGLKCAISGCDVSPEKMTSLAAGYAANVTIVETGIDGVLDDKSKYSMVTESPGRLNHVTEPMAHCPSKLPTDIPSIVTIQSPTAIPELESGVVIVSMTIPWILTPVGPINPKSSA